MSTRIVNAPLAGHQVETIDRFNEIGRIIDPQPLITTGRNWVHLIGPLMSPLVLAAVIYQLRQTDFSEMLRIFPDRPAFWLAFILYYLAGPASEWIIFRRLWALPAEGFAALLYKLVSNEILLGYFGEVYFYGWARRNAKITTAPFGAIKDVTILSALAGNVVTLVMVIAAVPLFKLLPLGVDNRAFELSAIFVLGTSVVALFLRKRLFTLPRRELRLILAIHFGRILATIVLAAAMWHLLLPAVALSWWLLLATFRQLLSRLPFLPNKDVVFAGLAVFLVGQDGPIVSAMALMASLILAAHLLVGGVLGAADLAREGRRA